MYLCGCVGERSEGEGEDRWGGIEGRRWTERMRMNILIRNYLAHKISNLVINDYLFRGNQYQQKLP